jgi:hypothetical protein
MPNGNAKPTPPPLPPLIESGPPRDVRAEFAEKSPPGRDQEESVRAFIQAKWDMLRGDTTFDPRIRELVYADFAQRVRDGAKIPPVPGGEGFGAFYTPGFKTAFNRGTSLYWHAICPTRPGGNVSTYLYLTATNRASHGCEALVHYNGQTDAHFSVYDWSLPESDKWRTDIAFPKLGDYLGEEAILGEIRQTLPIWNSTYEIFEVEQETAEEIPNPTVRWRNDVLLYHHEEKRWHLIYRNDYFATRSRQRSSFVGSWGPLVETFQPYYHDTEDFGTTTTQLNGENRAGRWGGWHELGPLVSTIHNCDKGFFSRYLDPNFRWVVGS